MAAPSNHEVNGAVFNACHTAADVSENSPKKLSQAERRARTVEPQVKSREARRQTVERATSKVSGRSPIDFVRTVRGG